MNDFLSWGQMGNFTPIFHGDIYFGPIRAQ